MNNNDFENKNFGADENGNGTNEAGAYSSGQRRYSANYTPPDYVPNFTVVSDDADGYKGRALGPQKKEKKTFGILAIVISCVISILVSTTIGVFVGSFAGSISGTLSGGGTAFGLSFLGGNQEEAAINIIRSDRDITVSELPGNTGYSDLTVAQVAALVGDSVVEITTSQIQTNIFYGQYVTSGAGSGVVFDQNGNYGYIVTNYHVIDGANKITVRVKDGDSHKEFDAEYIAGDSAEDIAVIRINAGDHKLTKAVFVSDSDKLIVGEEVVAIGNPLGELGGTVTNGIISALDREIVIDGNTMVLLQTNAAINPGNSGGGLFNMAGELVGIVNAKQASTGIEGLGFAIPANNVAEAVKGILDKGYVAGRPSLGIAVEYGTWNHSKIPLFGGSEVTGVIVTDPGKTQFEKGDCIRKIGDQDITSISDYNKALRSLTIDSSVVVKVERENGKMVDISLKITENTSKY